MPRDEIIQWADGFLLVYSITDRSSFNSVKKLRQYIYDTKQVSKDNGQNGSPQFPIVIVANKSDLIHLRQVSTEEGKYFVKSCNECCVKNIHYIFYIGGMFPFPISPFQMFSGNVKGV